jgi:hypothetical protein
MQEDRGYGQMIEGVFFSKEAVEERFGHLGQSYDTSRERELLGGNYWLEEHEVVK